MNVMKNEPQSERRSTRCRRTPTKPAWELVSLASGHKEVCSPKPQVKLSENKIKTSEGICHHCRKCRSKKQLTSCKSRGCKLSFCALCLKKYNYKMCPVCNNECKCKVCEQSIIEEDLCKMDYLVKTSSNRNVSEQVKEDLKFTDKKKIIQQNNWAICSFNYDYNRNFPRNENSTNEFFNPKYLEQEFIHYSNLPTMDYEFTNCPSNKIDMNNPNILPNYNEDSTEEFDVSVSQVAIRLPLCGKGKLGCKNKQLSKSSHTTSTKNIELNNSHIKQNEGAIINLDTLSNSQDLEAECKGPFTIIREKRN